MLYTNYVPYKRPCRGISQRLNIGQEGTRGRGGDWIGICVPIICWCGLLDSVFCRRSSVRTRNPGGSLPFLSLFFAQRLGEYKTLFSSIFPSLVGGRRGKDAKSSEGALGLWHCLKCTVVISPEPRSIRFRFLLLLLLPYLRNTVWARFQRKVRHRELDSLITAGELETS